MFTLLHDAASINFLETNTKDIAEGNDSQKQINELQKLVELQVQTSRCRHKWFHNNIRSDPSGIADWSQQHLQQMLHKVKYRTAITISIPQNIEHIPKNEETTKH